MDMSLQEETPQDTSMLENVSIEREVWVPLLILLPLKPRKRGLLLEHKAIYCKVTLFDCLNVV